ncbi:F0F1 ATP synthase subunit delta [Helicobacter pylori]|uniref:ATP synthase F1, delta subunit n=1 Tax=Helicobacter pylori HP260AFii TaxID=1159077 RepID=A0ABC9S898_HELPX|nr:F0F1 ATP synthase subunit delta [Helicobacter pylori]EMH18797.1 putative ATP synthase F1, delta subunit [Helicobacter pylori GAM260ASi]EMH27739.1 putative ATP synthase F1, delta subunit [Helicobacter pylori GAM268Bii]EMH61391.1 putative ATP synthase F1, delta subunit [Helicobacter pylori HP260AFi]EMH64821.1 putative ATP synthase F1, delta subunit [Helicobacter pylori HP260AFii]EMH65686.1 putative ATP synthase F1, delta subunit [Helicobacter pylori HP260ASii]
MQDLKVISKHYAKALKNHTKGDLALLEEIVVGLKNLAEAIKLHKLNQVLAHVSLKVKKEVVLEILEKITPTKACSVLKPVMEVVLKNNRLDMLELVAEELSFDSKRTLEATLLVPQKLENNELEEVRQKLQARFNAPVEIAQDTWSKKGVSLSVSSLDLEIGFSKEDILKKIEKQVIQSI